MAQNEQLTVEVVLDSKGVEVGFRDLTGRIRDFEGKFLKMNDGLKVVTKQFNELGAEAQAAFKKADPTTLWGRLKNLKKGLEEVALPLLAINQAMGLVNQAMALVNATIGTTVRQFTQLETAIARINTLIPEAARGAFDFAAAIREQQKLFGTDVGTAGKAFYEAIASGAVDAGGAIELMSTAQKLAVGGVTTLDTAVSALTTVMSAYGVSASEAGKIADTLFIAAAGGKTDIDQLSKQLGDVVGIARAAGVSFEEVASAISAVTAAGQPTAIATTGVRAAISELLTPTKELSFALKNIGIESVEAAIKQEGFVGVLRRVADAYGGNATALAALFARIESLPAITALVSGKVGKQFDAMHDSARDNTRAMNEVSNKAFQIMADTTEFRMGQARGAIDAELSRIGEIFTKSFGGAAATVAESAQKILETMTELARLLVPIVAKVAEVFGSLLDVISTVARGWGYIIQGAVDASYALEEFLGLREKAMSGEVAPDLATSGKSTSAQPAPVIDQQAVRDAVMAMEKIREETKRVMQQTQLVGKTQVEQAEIERRLKLEQLDLTEKQLQKMGLLGKINKQSLDDSRAAINAYYAAVGKQAALEELEKKTEEQKRALEEQRRAIESVGKAYLAFNETVEKLVDSLAMLRFDSAALRSTPIQQELDAAERAYQVSLLAIQLDKERAIQAGVSAKAADEIAARAIQIAESIRQQTEGLKVQKDVREAMLAAEKSAESALAGVRADTARIDENLYRLGMNRTQILEREYELEIDKLDAIERQAAAAGKLDEARKAELDRAREAYFRQLQVAKAEERKRNADGGGVVGKGIEMAQSFLDRLSKVPNLIAQIISAIARLPQLIVGIVEAATDLVTKQLAEFPAKLMQALQRQLGAVNESFFQSFIAQLQQTIPKILTTALATLPKQLSQMTTYFIPQIIGALIAGIIEALPQLIAYATQVFTSELPKSILLIVSGIIKAIPMIVKALAKALPKIVPAVVEALIEGVKEIGRAFLSIFTGVNPFDGAGDALAAGIQDGLKKLTGFRSELFGVTEDLATQAVDEAQKLIESAKAAGQSIWEALASAIRRAWEWIKGIGRAMWEGFVALARASLDFVKALGVAIWNGTKETALASLDFLKGLGRALWDGTKEAVAGSWDFVKSIGKALWQGVVDSVSGIWEALKLAGTKVWEGLKALFSGDGSEAIAAFKAAGVAIWSGLKGSVEGAWDLFTKIGTTIWGGLKAGFESAATFLEGIGGTIWAGLKKGFSSATDGMAKILSALDVGSLIGKLFKDPNPGKGKVEGWLGVDVPFLKFAEGGMVPGRPFVMGDSERNDVVPALLSPGEAVIPRSLMKDPAIEKLVNGILAERNVPQFNLGRVATAVVTGGASEAVRDDGAVKQAADSLKAQFDALSGDAKAAWDFLKRNGASLDLGAFVKDPLSYATEAFKGILGSFFEGRVDEIFGGIFQANAFAAGGLVPGLAGGGDVVPARLSAGEFVMRRSATEAIGPRVLASMNATGKVPSGGERPVNVTLNVTTTQPIDDQFIRTKLMPAVKKEFRAASNRGEDLMSDRGIRSTK